MFSVKDVEKIKSQNGSIFKSISWEIMGKNISDEKTY